MFKKLAVIAFASLTLAACAQSQPRVIQASADAPEIHLRPGMATQVEMPDNNHVQSVIVGNPNLVAADRVDNVVNLVPKTGSGETNMIVRVKEEDGEIKVYQYHLYVAE